MQPRWHSFAIAIVAALALSAGPARAGREILLDPPAAAKPPSRLGRIIAWLRPFTGAPVEVAEFISENGVEPPAGLDYIIARSRAARGQVEPALAALRRALAEHPSAELAESARQEIARLESVLAARRLAPVVCPAHRSALIAVEDEHGNVDRNRAPLVVVPGYGGVPSDLDAVVRRFRAERQVYVVCYESQRLSLIDNGRVVARQLAGLARFLGKPVEVTVVAHSLGGLVARVALNELTLTGQIPRFRKLVVWAVDSPWHGYVGPGDHGAEGRVYQLAEPLLTAGLRQMRARSDLFQGAPGSADPLERAGLFGVQLGPQIELHLVFARRGEDVLAYNRGVLGQLPDLLVQHFAADRPVRGPELVINYWRALLSSSDYDAFAEAARHLADQDRLDRNAMVALLLRHFPLFPGDHVTVLRDQPRGSGLVDYLARHELGGAAHGGDSTTGL